MHLRFQLNLSYQGLGQTYKKMEIELNSETKGSAFSGLNVEKNV